MSKKEKLLAKFKRKPIPSDVSFAEADKLLKLYGFIQRPPKRGSHHIYTHNINKTIKVNVPKERGKRIKKAYVQNIVKAIEAVLELNQGN